MKERCYNCGSDKHLALQCPYIKTGPAPKEEEMGFDVRCKKYDREFNAHTWTTKFCRECAKTRTTERRAVARDAYMAALGGLGAAVDVKDPVGEAVALAIETVRRWDSFLAAVDAEGGE